MRIAREFRCHPESVAAARHLVREALEDQPREIVDAAELLVSELATNCVRHAKTDFDLTIDSQPRVRIEVRDKGGGQPTMLTPAPEDPSGRGLRIVDAMASSWGVVQSSEGKTVWFTLEQPRGTGTESAGGGPQQRTERDDVLRPRARGGQAGRTRDPAASA